MTAIMTVAITVTITVASEPALIESENPIRLPAAASRNPNSNSEVERLRTIPGMNSRFQLRKFDRSDQLLLLLYPNPNQTVECIRDWQHSGRI